MIHNSRRPPFERDVLININIKLRQQVYILNSDCLLIFRFGGG